MKLPDKVYDVLKWILLTFVPALELYLPELADIYGWDTLTLIKTIAIVAGFLGTILGIGSISYAKDIAKEEISEEVVEDPYQYKGE